jgi:hypothetical protein
VQKAATNVVGTRLRSNKQFDRLTVQLLTSGFVKRTGELAYDLANLSALKAGGGLPMPHWLGKLGSLNRSPYPISEVNTVGNEYLDDEDYLNLLRWLASYVEAVEASFRNHEPAILMAYLTSDVTQLVE